MQRQFKGAILIILSIAVGYGRGRPERSGFYITSAGVLPYKHYETGMIMYASLRNEYSYDLKLTPTVDDCCEIFYTNEATCSHINVMMSPLSYLPAHSSANITFLYPTMFPHNRRGACRVSILYKVKGSTTSKVLDYLFNFNTYLPDQGTIKGSWRTFKTQCRTPDLNPFDNCNPVDCQMKYLSSRTYFSEPFQLCIPGPNCVFKKCDKGCPDIIYEPLSNTCQDLSLGISEDDLRTFHGSDLNVGAEAEEHVNDETLWHHRLAVKNIKCHHGRLNRKTSICDCSLGWTSTPFDWEQYVPSNSYYHMCNTLLQSTEYYYPKILSINAGNWIRSAIICSYILFCCVIFSLFRLEPKRTLFPRKKPFRAIATVESYGNIGSEGQLAPTGSDSLQAIESDAEGLGKDPLFSEYNLVSNIFDQSEMSNFDYSKGSMSSIGGSDADSDKPKDNKSKKKSKK